MYAEFLRSKHLEVRHARSPELALQALDARPPAVVVIDVAWTGATLSGEFIAMVRARPWCRDVAIIVVSGWSRVGDRLAARDAGADVFLVKPALPEQVLEYVVAALDGDAGRTNLAWNWLEDVVDDRRRTKRRMMSAEVDRRTRRDRRRQMP